MNPKPVDGGRPLVDELTDRLRSQIVSGQLKIGMRLHQSTLAEEFDVSRTPIREALRKLESEGLVDLVPHRGALVRGPTPREVREAYEVRAELEGLAAEKAANWITEEVLARLTQADAEFQRYAEETGSGSDVDGADGWVRANDLFHEAIQEAANNDQLQRVIQMLHRSFPRNLTGLALGNDRWLARRNAEEHRRILEAIEARNGAEARQAMADHVRRSGEIVAMWFERYSERMSRQ